MTKPFPAKCIDCEYSIVDPSSTWQLLCKHPKINAKDAHFLGASNSRGTSCMEERGKSFWFAKCGTAGKLWKPNQ